MATDDFYPDDETVDEPASVTPEVTSPVQVASADDAPPWLDYAPAAKQRTPAPASQSASPAPAAAPAAPATPKSQDETPPWLDYAPAARPSGFWSNFGRGFERGAIGGNAADIASTSQGMAEIFGGDAPQWTKDLEKWGQSFQEGSLAPDTETWSEAYQKGAGGLWSHLGGVIGETIGGVAPVVAGGALGTAVGGGAGTAAEPGGGTVAGGFLGMGAGALAGMSLPAFVQGYGSSYRGLRDDPGVKAKVEDGQLTDQDVARIAVVPGLISTALNVIPVGKITGIGAISKEAVDEAVKNSIVKVLAKDTAGMTLAGFSTAVVNETAQALTGGDADAANRVSRVLDQTVTAAVTGLGLGTVTIGAEKVGGKPGGSKIQEAPEKGPDAAETEALKPNEPAPSGAGASSAREPGAQGEAGAGGEQPGDAEIAETPGPRSAASPGAPGGSTFDRGVEILPPSGISDAERGAVATALPNAGVENTLDQLLEQFRREQEQKGQQQPAPPVRPVSPIPGIGPKGQEAIDRALAAKPRIRLKVPDTTDQRPPAAGPARPEDVPAAPPVGVAPEPPPATPEPQTLHMTPEDAELVRRASELTDAFKLTDNGDGSHTLEHPSLTPEVNGPVTAHAEPTGRATTSVELTRQPDRTYALSRVREPALAELGQKQKQQRVKAPPFTPEAREAFVERARNAKETHGSEVQPWTDHALTLDGLTRTAATPEARQKALGDLERLHDAVHEHGVGDRRDIQAAETPSKPGDKGERAKATAKARAEAKDARSVADKARQHFVIGVRDALEERGVERSRAEKIAHDEADRRITEFSASKETDPRAIADALHPAKDYLDRVADAWKASPEGQKHAASPPAPPPTGAGRKPPSLPPEKTPKGMGPKAKLVWSKFRTAVEDMTIPLQRLQEHLDVLRGGKGPDAHTARRLMEGRIAHGARRITDEFVGPLRRLLKESKLKLEDVDRYLYARHAEERNRFIEIEKDPNNKSGSGMSTVEARDILAKIPANKRAAYEKIGKLVDTLRKADLDRRVGAGLMTPEARQRWLDQFKHYVPLSGFDEADRDEHGGAGTPRELQVVGSETRKAEGRKTTANSPTENAIRQSLQGVTRAEKNRVAGTLGDAVRSAVKDPWNKDNIVRVVKTPAEAGKNTLGEALSDPKVVGFKKNGVQRFLVFRDADVAKAVMRMDPAEMPGVLRGALRVQNFVKQLYTHYSPDFLIRHFAFRYPIEGALNLQKLRGEGINPSTARYFRDGFAAVPSIYKALRGGDPTGRYATALKEMSEHGGVMDMRALWETIDAAKDTLAHLQGPTFKEQPIRAVWNASLGQVFDRLHTLTAAADNALRLAVYMQARKELGPQRAALLARDATVDFNRRGTMANYLSLVVPFWNVAAQTGSSLMRGLARNKGRNAFTYTMLGTSMLAAAAQRWNYSAGNDDDGVPWIDKVPAWKRRMNIVLLDPFNPDKAGRPGEIHIPLPYIALPFWAAGNAATSAATGTMKAGKIASELFEASLAAFTPFGDVGPVEQLIVPNLLRPLAQNAMNEDWTGKPLYHESGSGVPRSDQGITWPGHGPLDQATTDFSNAAAPAIRQVFGADWHPEEVKNFITSYLGTTTREIDEAWNTATNFSGTNPDYRLGERVVYGQDWPAAERAYDKERKQDAGGPSRWQNISTQDRDDVMKRALKLTADGRGEEAKKLVGDFNTEVQKSKGFVHPITEKALAKEKEWLTQHAN